MKKNFRTPILLRRWGPALLMMGVIFAFSSIPSQEMPQFGAADFTIKKLGHMTGYALLAYAILSAIGKEKPNAYLVAWGLTVLYALSDELHQSFVPGRNAALMDVGIDALGALFGLLPVLLMRRKLSGSSQKV